MNTHEAEARIRLPKREAIVTILWGALAVGGYFAYRSDFISQTAFGLEVSVLFISYFVLDATFFRPTIVLRITRDGLVEQRSSGGQRTITFEQLKGYAWRIGRRGYEGFELELRPLGVRVNYVPRSTVVVRREEFRKFYDHLIAAVAAHNEKLMHFSSEAEAIGGIKSVGGRTMWVLRTSIITAIWLYGLFYHFVLQKGDESGLAMIAVGVPVAIIVYFDYKRSVGRNSG